MSRARSARAPIGRGPIGGARVAKRIVAAGALTVGAQVAAAVLWPVPAQTEFDASGSIGSGSGPPLLVAVLGDSSCTGPGITSVDDLWSRIVALRLSAALDRPVDLHSFARGGACAHDLLADQVGPASALRPHLTLISVGANDVFRRVPIRRFEQRLDAVVETMAATGSLVVLSGVGDLGTIPRLTPPLSRIIARLGRRADGVHATVASRHGAIKVEQWGWSRQQYRTRRDLWSLDHFHPNGAGHLVWAEAAWESIVRLLPALSETGRG